MRKFIDTYVKEFKPTVPEHTRPSLRREKKMQGVTLALIELQTICLAFGESLIDKNTGEYKKVPDAFKVISNVWQKCNNEIKNKITSIIEIE